MTVEDRYMVMSGYDGRVIAQHLTWEQCSALLDKFLGADCPPPIWKREF